MSGESNEDLGEAAEVLVSLKVKTVDGREILMDVASTALVSDVVTKVLEATSSPSSKVIRLIYSGRQLVHTHTLESYKIGTNSTDTFVLHAVITDAVHRPLSDPPPPQRHGAASEEAHPSHGHASQPWDGHGPGGQQQPAYEGGSEPSTVERVLVRLMPGLLLGGLWGLWLWGLWGGRGLYGVFSTLALCLLTALYLYLTLPDLAFVTPYLPSFLSQPPAQAPQGAPQGSAATALWRNSSTLAPPPPEAGWHLGEVWALRGAVAVLALAIYLVL